MSPDRATAILALVEANRALEIAHRAVVRLGESDIAAECSDMGADVAAMIGDLSGRRRSMEPQVEVAS